MSNAIPGGPSAQPAAKSAAISAAPLTGSRPAAAPAGTDDEPSRYLQPVFAGVHFSDAWLDTLNLQFGVEQ